MNCNEVEKLILLSQSGELSARKRQRLESHVAACAECRAFEAETALMATAARRAAALDPRPVQAEILQRILRDAERRPAAPVLTWAPALRPLLAMAAGLVLIVGIWSLPNVRSLRSAKNHAGHNGLGDLSSLLTLMIGADQEDSGAEAVAPASLTRGAMADRILFLQGMSVETPEPDVEEPSLPEELQPTTLQWHSTPGVPFERCG